MLKAILILTFAVAAGFFIFLGLETWFSENPWEVRRLTLDFLSRIPKDMARWIFLNTENIDQLSHYLITLISCTASSIIFCFEIACCFPLDKSKPAP